MRASHTLLSVALCATLAFAALPACKKKKQDAAQSAPAPAQPAPPPGMDKAAAVKALIPHVWTGVLQGKPLKLYVAQAGGIAVGMLRFGEMRVGGRMTINPQGRFTLSSRPRPTSKGLETVRFNLRIKPDFTMLAGNAERSSKQGFVEQSSGLGDFTLEKGPALKGAPILSQQPKGSFGAAVGLRLWDELIEIDGKKVSPGDEIQTPNKVGKEVKLVVLRNGERVELEGTVPPPMKPTLPAPGAQKKAPQPVKPAAPKEKDDE